RPSRGSRRCRSGAAYRRAPSGPGRAVARSRRKVTRGLVAPRSVERVLGDRKQFDVREPEVVAMRGEAQRDVAVVQEPPVLLALPRTEMHFVDRDRRAMRLQLATSRHPFAIAPAVAEVP